jgi:Asp-tRNA(Asn)/Glu-tRNA(Gln) amidotransferase A subunit family amidase
VQIVTRPWEEELALTIAETIEHECGKKQHPPEA